MDYDLRGTGTSILMPEGWNTVLVVDISIETSSKGNEMWVVSTEEPLTGSVDKTYAVTKKSTGWVFSSFLKACGYARNAQGIYENIEPEHCIGMSVEAQNKPEPNEFTRRDGEVVKEMRNKFVLFRAAKEKATL